MYRLRQLWEPNQMFQNVLAQTKPIGPELLAAQYISGGVQIFTLNSFSFGIKNHKSKYCPSLPLAQVSFCHMLICNYDNAELRITHIVQVWSIHYSHRVDETQVFPLLVTHYCFVWCDYKMSLKNYAATFSSVCETSRCQRAWGLENYLSWW